MHHTTPPSPPPLLLLLFLLHAIMSCVPFIAAGDG